MKITLKTRKSRNPFVAVSMQRLAGSHGRRGASVKARREGRDEIRRELRTAPRAAVRSEHDPHSP
jgi:hypothetical protein